MQKRLALLVAISISALPLVAQAQRKSPLADAPPSASASSCGHRASSSVPAQDRRSTRTSFTACSST